MNNPDFDVQELATYLHLSPQQVERLAGRSQIPARKVGGEWRFSRAEVHHWMENRMGVLDDTQLEQVERQLQRDVLETAPGPGSVAELLPLAGIAVPLAARTKSSVISEMTNLAAETGLVWDPDKMAEAVRQREELHTTALENGVALLHPRRPMSSILAQPLWALGITGQGIPFGGGRMLTDIFFLICSTNDRGHLQTLARLSRLITVEGLLDQLRHAPDAAAAREILIRADEALTSATP
jgi:PTS system nitrogen regulatory IIA component